MILIYLVHFVLNSGIWFDGLVLIIMIIIITTTQILTRG